MLEPSAALILIDVQKAFLDPSLGPANNPDVAKTISRLLKYWRHQGKPVIHIQHLSTEPGSLLRASQPGADFMDEAIPADGERVIQKNVNSAFIGTDLEKILRAQNIKHTYFCGYTIDHCVSTTVRMAKNLGFLPTLIADATAAFDRIDHRGNRYKAELVHAVSIASLNQEFADICEILPRIQPYQE